jgi:hypothetical protein
MRKLFFHSACGARYHVIYLNPILAERPLCSLEIKISRIPNTPCAHQEYLDFLKLPMFESIFCYERTRDISDCDMLLCMGWRASTSGYDANHGTRFGHGHKHGSSRMLDCGVEHGDVRPPNVLWNRYHFWKNRLDFPHAVRSSVDAIKPCSC